MQKKYLPAKHFSLLIKTAKGQLMKETSPDKPADQKLIEMLSISANEPNDKIKKTNFDYIRDIKDQH